MRCTNKRRFKRRNRKRELFIRLTCSIVVLIGIVSLAFILSSSKDIVEEYEMNTYGTSVYHSDLFADQLCVEKDEIDFEAFHTNDEFHGALLMNLDTKETLFSEHPNEQLYPASITKIFTSYVALKYGNLTDVITVSENAVDIPSDSSKANLQSGDQLTLEDALYALMLPSGNDSAVAIAEHISGSVEEFAALMNEEAQKIGATNSHFVNPHGYQDKEHYTTAYDIYLVFNECIKNQTFLDIISSTKRSAVITQRDGSSREITWAQSNQFLTGARKVPNGITMIGGKTGTTFDAGACLVLYEKTSDDTPYISIIMGASSRRNLYDNMTFLLAAIPD